MQNLITKKCSNCKVEMSVELFSRNKNSKDGRKPRCKPCTKTYMKIWAGKKAVAKKAPIKKAPVKKFKVFPAPILLGKDCDGTEVYFGDSIGWKDDRETCGTAIGAHGGNFKVEHEDDMTNEISIVWVEKSRAWKE